MSIREVIATLNQMEADGVIERYAIGGAVGATFYLEPLATLDVDVFVAFGTEPGKRIASPKPIFDYLLAHGCSMQGEYVMIAGWPVQCSGDRGGPIATLLGSTAEKIALHRVEKRWVHHRR